VLRDHRKRRKTERDEQPVNPHDANPAYIEATAHRRAALEETWLLPIAEGTLADVFAANKERS
jgi:hypothetical protein